MKETEKKANLKMSQLQLNAKTVLWYGEVRVHSGFQYIPMFDT